MIIDVLFVVVVTIFCSAFVFNINIFEGDDLNYHIYRIIGLSDAFSDGQILPKLYPYANYGFGYGTSLFYCDLYLYPFAWLYKMGASMVVSYKIMVICLALLTTVIMLLVTKKMFTKNITPYVLTTLYMFSNYRFVNVVSRAAIAEAYSMAFIPLVYMLYIKY